MSIKGSRRRGRRRLSATDVGIIIVAIVTIALMVDLSPEQEGFSGKVRWRETSTAAVVLFVTVIAAYLIGKKRGRDLGAREARSQLASDMGRRLDALVDLLVGGAQTRGGHRPSSHELAAMHRFVAWVYTLDELLGDDAFKELVARVLGSLGDIYDSSDPKHWLVQWKALTLHPKNRIHEVRAVGICVHGNVVFEMKDGTILALYGPQPCRAYETRVEVDTDTEMRAIGIVPEVGGE